MFIISIITTKLALPEIGLVIAKGNISTGIFNISKIGLKYENISIYIYLLTVSFMLNVLLIARIILFSKELKHGKCCLF